MITGGANSCFPNIGDHHQGLPIFDVVSHEEEDVVSGSMQPNSAATVQSGSFLYSLSVLKDKVHQVQSLASIFLSPDEGQAPHESTGMAVATMGTLIQEIVMTASSMMFTCQQMAIGTTTSANNNNNHNSTEMNNNNDNRVPLPAAGGGALDQQQDCGGNRVAITNNLEEKGQQSFYSSETLDWYGDNYDNSLSNNNAVSNNQNEGTIKQQETESCGKVETYTANYDGPPITDHHLSPKNYCIVELDAADLLAKYTHYCHVCGKGFKRDANLRMHMRAHGDEYKSAAALSNPMKNINGSVTEKEDDTPKLPMKYSCPQEGCRWNRKHAKFQPLKSMICVKNHYKRSHCPKMYVCKRCNRKQFSVLSDLRTHEKHCGDLKWQCSCGTTFSRKDKLMGHVALFVGHTPAINSLMKMGKTDQTASQLRFDEK